MRRRTFVQGAALAFATPSFAQEAALPAVLDYERASAGRVGLFARNLRTDRTLAWRADDRFVMCSTFKASLVACVLARVDRGMDALDRTIPYGPSDLRDWYAPVAAAHLAQGRLSVAAMCEAAVERSDNTCASLLLTRVGGPAALTAFWQGLGDRVTRLDDPEPDLNRTPPGGLRNTTTPRSMAGILRQLVTGPVLSKESRDRLTGWLVGCRTGDNRLRAGLPRRFTIGDKTGNNGKDAAGDIAIVWPTPDTPIVVCVYTRGGSPTAPQLDRLFAGVGRSVAEHLITAGDG